MMSKDNPIVAETPWLFGGPERTWHTSNHLFVCPAWIEENFKVIDANRIKLVFRKKHDRNSVRVTFKRLTGFDIWELAVAFNGECDLYRGIRIILTKITGAKTRTLTLYVSCEIEVEE